MPDDETDTIDGIGSEADERSKRDRFITGDDEEENDEAERQRAPKRLRVSDPDVLVKVGDQEFEHYSVLLCATSPYFDAMLSVNMRERLSGKIEFTDKDPKDWEALVPYLEPHSPPLNLEKTQQLLPWFHELQMDALLEEADRVFKNRIQETREKMKEGEVNKLLSILELSDKYSLHVSKEAALECLEYWIRKRYIILGSRGVSQLIPFLNARDSLWDLTKKYLPDEFRNSNKEELLRNPLFPFLVSARWQLRKQQKDSRQFLTPRGAGQNVAHAALDPLNVREQNAANVQEAVAAAVEHIQREF